MSACHIWSLDSTVDKNKPRGHIESALGSLIEASRAAQSAGMNRRVDDYRLKDCYTQEKWINDVCRVEMIVPSGRSGWAVTDYILNSGLDSVFLSYDEEQSTINKRAFLDRLMHYDDNVEREADSFQNEVEIRGDDGSRYNIYFDSLESYVGDKLDENSNNPYLNIARNVFVDDSKMCNDELLEMLPKAMARGVPMSSSDEFILAIVG
jgi:hypothetical protein